MRIVGVCGSPRPLGNTRRLVEWVLEACARRGAETELLSAADARVDFCRACEACMRTGTCPVTDDYLAFLPHVLAADALVLATPNYAFDVSAQFKAIMDRSHAFLYYAQALRGKVGAGLCVGGHPARTRAIARRCAHAVWLCGGNPIGFLAAISRHRDRPGLRHETVLQRRADRLGAALVRAVQTRRRFPLQDALREIVVVRHLKRWFHRSRNRYPYVAEQLLGARRG